VAAPVVLEPLEPDPLGSLVDRAHHPQPLGAGERAQPAPKVDGPGRARIIVPPFERRRPGNDVEPLGVVREVVDPREQPLR
jgi:hypothetical protein